MSAEIKKFIEQEFYYFHENPELSFKEFKTTQRLKDDLKAHNIEVLPLDLNTGLVASIGKGSKTVALRADIDALPVTEETDLSYKSKVDGVMHACGHDSHAAIVLGAAILLKKNEQDLNGNVRIIFQPAEEAPGGAREIIKAGALDNVDAIFGIHSASIFEVGSIGISAGPTHSAVEKFKIKIKGKGAHAAHPEEGYDPLVAASHLVTAAQSIVSRNIAASDAAVVSITRLDAGTTWNVIPDSVELEGTIRTYSKIARTTAKDSLERVVKGIGLTFNVDTKLEWVIEVPATDNDKALATFAKKVAEDLGLNVQKSPKSMGGEDFSLYQELVKGLFIQIGTGKTYPNHNPKFKVDPAAIYPASIYLAKLITEYLKA